MLSSFSFASSYLKESAACKQRNLNAVWAQVQHVLQTNAYIPALSLISCLTPSSLDFEKQEVRGRNNWKHLIFHHFNPESPSL